MWKDRLVAGTLLIDTVLFTAALVVPLTTSTTAGWGYVVLLAGITAVALLLSFSAATFLLATTDVLAPRLIVGGLGLLLALLGLLTLWEDAGSMARFDRLCFGLCAGPALILTAAIPKPNPTPLVRGP